MIEGDKSYVYKIESDNIANKTQDQTGLKAGTYTVLVTDQNGCTETKVYTLDEPQAITFSSTVSLFAGNFNISCKDAKDGSINITPSGGSGSYIYSWSSNNGSGLVQGNQNQSGFPSFFSHFKQ